VKQILEDSRNNFSEGNDHHLPAGSDTENKLIIVRLVDEAADGSFEAFGNLYRLHVNQIYQYVFYQVRNNMVAEDITADVFVRALDRIDSCKGKGATFTAWLYRIAYNRVIDYFRSNRRNLPLESDGVYDLGDIKQDPFKHLERQELYGAIMELPATHRQVIILKFIVGLDNREIGHVIHKSEGAIRIIQMRALASLRKKLDKR